ESVRHMTHPALSPPAGLWRLSVPALAKLDLPGEAFIDWGGAQRWLAADLPPSAAREAAKAAGGHATLFYGKGPVETPFAPLAPPLLALHQRLKAALDPQGVLNPGRLHPDF
ncbi:MAG TPA: FAD-linked oxidase C-terminal domain-containing protein, partial [Caulobacteraceae bacterium]